MEKILKSKTAKRMFISFFIIIIVACVFNFGYRFCFGKLEESDISEYYIYTPTGVPKEYKQQLIGVDSYKHWIYKLNKEEQIAVTEDIETDKWIKANEEDIYYIKEFSNGMLPFYIDFNDCYVVYYNFNEDKIINDYKYIFGPDAYSTQTMMHIYDTQTHLYYCAYWTI